MPRRKSGGIMLPWLSARLDNREGRFVMAGNSLLLSRKFQELSAGARCLYFSMCLEAAGRREFCFPCSAAKKYGFAETSFSRYIRELKEKQFLEVAFSGRFSHEKNLYRFSLDWKKEDGR